MVVSVRQDLCGSQVAIVFTRKKAAGNGMNPSQGTREYQRKCSHFLYAFLGLLVVQSGDMSGEGKYLLSKAIANWSERGASLVAVQAGMSWASGGAKEWLAVELGCDDPTA